MTKEEAMSEMERLITVFPNNILDAIKIGQSAVSSFKTKRVKNVLISGLGGSGIGGKFASQLIWDQCSVPIQLVHDYRIPEWVDADTLFIVSSYSGNTEETLSTLAGAMSKNAEITCITSGGNLEALSREKGLNIIKIPGGQPPRTSFGFNALQQLFILSAYELIDNTFVKDLHTAAKLLQKEQGLIKAEAAAIAH